jgi:hypothetical protein
MPQIFFYCLHTFISVGIYCMSFSIDERAELDNELLKSIKIQLLRFSFVQKFDIDISY